MKYRLNKKAFSAKKRPAIKGGIPSIIDKRFSKNKRLSGEDKKYFEENREELLDIIMEDPLLSVIDAINDHRKNNK